MSKKLTRTMMTKRSHVCRPVRTANRDATESDRAIGKETVVFHSNKNRRQCEFEKMNERIRHVMKPDLFGLGQPRQQSPLESHVTIAQHVE